MADLQTDFVMSMAVVIAAAAVIIILFHRFRQPLILGYLLAGMLVGPFVISARDSVELLAKLGIILLTFSIGLEFNLKKLRKIGVTVITAASLEIVMMIGFGFLLGRALGWTALEATLLGAILSVASTMIIVRSLRESGGLDNDRARLIVGILIVEDFAAVLILAAVSGLISTGGVDARELAMLVLKMAIFIAASIVFGVAALPRLVDYVGKQRSGELLIVTVLGLCFSMSYFAKYIGFTEAIGAFIMGIIISESKYIGDVIRKVEPVRDLFGAIFFITVGMLVDLSLFYDVDAFIIPVLIVTAVFVLAKMFSCTFSTFLFGFGSKNAIGTGLGMVAIGEFSLMIAATAIGSSAIRETVYPIIVLVTTITALIVPYSIMSTGRVTRSLEGKMPRSFLILTQYLNLVLTTARRRSKSSVHTSYEMRNNISILLVNIVIVVTVLLTLSLLVPNADDYSSLVGGDNNLMLALMVVGALLLIYPALRSIYYRSIRLVEVFTSEAMLGTRSAEYVGYNATSRVMKSILIAIYMLIGLVAVYPLFHSLLQESLLYAAFALAIIAVIVLALRSSIQTVNEKVSEVFERRGSQVETDEFSPDLAEIEAIIAEMEREQV